MMIVDVFQCYLKSTLRTSPSHAHDHHPATNATKTVFSSSFECGEVEAAEAAEAAEGLGSWHDWGHSQAFRILQRIIFFKNLDRVQLHSFSCTWYSFEDQDFESFGYDVFLKSNKPATSHHPSPQSSHLAHFILQAFALQACQAWCWSHLSSSSVSSAWFGISNSWKWLKASYLSLHLAQVSPQLIMFLQVVGDLTVEPHEALVVMSTPHVCQWLSPQLTEVGSGLATAQKFALARWRGPAAPCGILTYHVYSCQLSYFRYWLIE